MTVTITKVVGGQLTGVGGRKTRKPVIYMQGTEKGLALNATNSKTIAALYGNHVEAWVDKRITLFKTTTTFGSEQMECVRIRPRVPPAKGQAGDPKLNSDPPPPPPDQLGEESAGPTATSPYEGTAKLLLAKIADCLSERSLSAVLGDYAEELTTLAKEAPEVHTRIQTTIEARQKFFAK